MDLKRPKMRCYKQKIIRTPIKTKLVYSRYKPKSPRPTIQRGGGGILREG